MIKPDIPDLVYEIDEEPKEEVLKFSKEEDFVDKFNEELKVNKSFDKIQKFIQHVIIQDPYLMRIIINSAI